MNLIALLTEKGIIDQAVATAAEVYATENAVTYEAGLIQNNVPAVTIRNAISEYYGLPAEEIKESDEIDGDILEYISEESARHYNMIPLRLEDGILTVGTIDPESFGLQDVLNFVATKRQITYQLVVILGQDFQHGMKSYENLTREVDEALGAIESDVAFQEEEKPDEDAKKALEHIKEDAPITKIVATILRYAVDGNASDIHIEPYDKKVKVRFRVDGQLSMSLELPAKVRSAVVARVKILASLRLDEKRKPQDGRFSAVIDKRKIDFRVSILPTNYGEKVVMRLLDTEKGVRKLEETGVSPHNVELIRKAIKQPYGIILISGPTGSGKSTTLYAMLSEVDRVSKNVLSLEDPVEYNIEGVSQSQVRPEIGYTFAHGLRSALRQDPDVIMVGEIRDKETAQLAIQAALTGHLVLSTIHTNNSIGVVPRLIDMGVDPFLIAPTLQIVIAQRLVRKICPGTGKEIPRTGTVDAMIQQEIKTLPIGYRDRIPNTDSVLQAEPSPECASGTKGRISVMEVLEINDEIERMILEGGTEDEMFVSARKNGFMTMKEDAIRKALEHTIPFEEVSTLGGPLFNPDEEEVIEPEQLQPEVVESTVSPEDQSSEVPETVSDLDEVTPVDNPSISVP